MPACLSAYLDNGMFAAMQIILGLEKVMGQLVWLNYLTVPIVALHCTYVHTW